MASEVVLAGVECICSNKRKAKDFAGEECQRAAKRIEKK
jgi:hypothetical protein